MRASHLPSKTPNAELSVTSCCLPSASSHSIQRCSAQATSSATIPNSEILAPNEGTLERLTACFPPPSGFDATVIVITKNRRIDALRAIRSAVDQAGAIEVLVICDGDTEGTAEMLVAEFGKRISLYRARASRGYIVQRNHAASLAQAPVLVSLDDDSAFSDRTTVAAVLPLFTHASVAAAAMPYVNILRDRNVLQKGRQDILLATDRYIGTAHAVRRDDFIRLGGYREEFVHQGEEADFCLRLLDEQRLTVLGATPPIHHFESSVRDTSRIMYFGRQNEVLFAAWNVPWPYVVPHLLYATLHGVVIGFRYRLPARAVAGLVSGYRILLRTRDIRRPVEVPTYRLMRRMRKRGPITVHDALSVLCGTARGSGE